ncbi:hypothetical protein BJV78DRAFT_1376972 [Lactifluus subvellereus]|nr:hypothetical protein BJV78DRAFT_1376972 [Lactifluus subvellereus]
MIEPGEGRKLDSAYPRADDPFIRHERYFFKDGNITFLVDFTLYCIHRYFFSRDSEYFATLFTQLGALDHEPLSTIISLGDIECRDFDAFLSVIYPENFEEHNLSYEEWVSVLHLSTRWGFASIRQLALAFTAPPTPYDRLLLARAHSVDHWVLPALSALCERTAPLSLDEARQMKIDDVVLVATARENICNSTLRVDTAEIPRRVEVAQAGRPSSLLGVDVPQAFSKSESTEQEPSSSMGAAANPNAAGAIVAEAIVAAPPVDPGQATGVVGDAHQSDCDQLGDVPREIGMQTDEQPRVARAMLQNTPEGGACCCTICGRKQGMVDEEAAAEGVAEEMEAERATEQIAARHATEEVETRRAAEEVMRRVAEEVAGRVAEEVARRVAKEVARRVAKKVARHEAKKSPTGTKKSQKEIGL